MSKTVAVLVGSLRKDSFTRKVAHAIGELAAPALVFDFVDIGGLPHFNQDLEANPPEAWTAFRARITATAAVLFATPEYNRSIPGVLKNAVDVGSRPYGQGVLTGKPAAIVSTSIGQVGGFGANHHLRQSLAFLNMPTLGQPEAYVGNSANLFDDAGKLTNEATREFLGKFATAFAAWIDRHG